MQFNGYYYSPQNGYDQFSGLQAFHDAVRRPDAGPSNSTGHGYGYVQGDVQQNTQQHMSPPNQQQAQSQPIIHPPPQQTPQFLPQLPQTQLLPQQHTPRQDPPQTAQVSTQRNTSVSTEQRNSDQTTARDTERKNEQNGNQNADQDKEQDKDHRSRGQQLNMPPVVGSMMHYANKHVKYRPFPPDIMAVREKLFKMDEPFLLDSQQIADYWPHMSNVWGRSTRPSVEPNGTVVEVWECRIRRRVESKGNKYGARQGTGMRNRLNKDNILGDSEACTPRIRVVSYTKHAENPEEHCGPPGFLNCKCLAEWAHFERTTTTRNKALQHTHDLDVCDRYKRTDGLMYCCKLKVEEHYTLPAVMRWIKEKFGHISNEVEYIQKHDIANVSRPWKQAHKGEEMRSQITEDTDADKRRKHCLDAIVSNPADRLREALSEVCKRIPEAMDIVIPFLDMTSADREDFPEISHGQSIKIPFPGLPHKRMLLYETSASVPASAPTSTPARPSFAAGASTPHSAPQPANNWPPPQPSYTAPVNPQIITLQPAPGPTATNATRASLPDVRSACMTDPETTHKAFIEASSALPPSVPRPYTSQHTRMPLQPIDRARNSGQPWRPLSVTHPVANGPAPRPRIPPAPLMQERPAWAQPVVPQKRSMEHPPERSRKSLPATPDQPRADGPSLVNEIASQLRKELAAS